MLVIIAFLMSLMSRVNTINTILFWWLWLFQYRLSFIMSRHTIKDKLILINSSKELQFYQLPDIHKLFEKQSSRRVLKKRCSENMQQIYGRHPRQSAISIKLLCNFIEISLRHGCSPINLLHIFRTHFRKNTSGRLLLKL